MPLVTAIDAVLPALETLFEQDPLGAMQMRGLLADPDLIEELRVDHTSAPRGVLCRKGTFYGLYARDEATASLLLDELDWPHQTISFAALPERWLRLIQARGQIQWQQPCQRHHLPPHAPTPRQRAKQLTSLTHEDIKRILTWWPYGDPAEDKDRAYAARLIGRGLATGWRQDGELVCWALAGEDRALGMLHTMEAWRRRGIAASVVAALTAAVRQRGFIPHGYVIEGNAGPLGIVKTLGYIPSAETYFWLGCEPQIPS